MGGVSRRCSAGKILRRPPQATWCARGESGVGLGRHSFPGRDWNHPVMHRSLRGGSGAGPGRRLSDIIQRGIRGPVGGNKIAAHRRAGLHQQVPRRPRGANPEFDLMAVSHASADEHVGHPGPQIPWTPRDHGRWTRWAPASHAPVLRRRQPTLEDEPSGWSSGQGSSRETIQKESNRRSQRVFLIDSVWWRTTPRA